MQYGKENFLSIHISNCGACHPAVETVMLQALSEESLNQHISEAFHRAPWLYDEGVFQDHLQLSGDNCNVYMAREIPCHIDRHCQFS